ncbi:mitochondrial assembly of ribosomal large subunit protein 1 [Anastrepha obliqua]|uniref:mitochondrial assembly of ribosomal large subunit protein 1 n=1 Tax=Anastrepha obliqua TaxID=95512 RepID=UPI00240A0FF7|nr:mitochondrial assembly of ribosomal large subunit protein 1 [Anastrepha obliqua]XP_054734302.1 mitochondrial assembly of ribosomal large subunit protein 1 [Anastrepha obliqua]
MLRRNVFHIIRSQKINGHLLRALHHEFTQTEPQTQESKGNKNRKVSPLAEAGAAQKSELPLPGVMRHKYKVFHDEDANEIFDVEEERQRYQLEEEPKQMANDEFLGLDLNHGKHGVFDVEDLVDVLRKESAEDIFVCTVPKDLKYVDYMVVCNGRSYRHMLAIAEFVRRIYKVKRHKGEVMPKIEGEKSRQWMALDLGNIALHVFSAEARELYDLESLWAIGIKYDKESNKPQDPLVELFENSIKLSDMQPKSTCATH